MGRGWNYSSRREDGGQDRNGLRGQRDRLMKLRDKFEAFKIGVAPLSLLFNHASECFGYECCIGAVKGNGDPASVLMLVAAVASAFTLA
jgi:hypothetical protein